ncbi:MAG: histidine phosphatase family protein [Sedimentitalea sp.]|nr:histidine phosphatase family protein [Sedimentitalea sp.]
MTRLHLVRHGPTHAKGMVGWSDLPADLSDQAALDRLSAALPDSALLVSSDLARAVQTADALAGRRTRLPHDRALREMHFGAWELRRHAEIEAEDPDRIRAFWEHPGETRPPGGESWHELSARVDAAIDALIAAHPGADLVIVAHFGVILTQVQRALRLAPDQAFAQRIAPLSLTCLIRTAAGWEAGPINRLP